MANVSPQVAKAALAARERRLAEDLKAVKRYSVRAYQRSGGNAEELGSYASRAEAVAAYEGAKASGKYQEVLVRNGGGYVVESYYNQYYKG